MTEEEFFERLRATKGWILKPYRLFDGIRYGLRIQMPDFSCCPITALTSPMRSGGDWDKAARELGLDLEFAERIVRAADQRWDHDPALRAKLLEACNHSVSIMDPAP